MSLLWPALGQGLSLADWRDGRAELSGYTLSQSRYGADRTGTAVLIVVTEPFSESARVKADPGRHPPEDVMDVVKLNFIKDFQTGIYDYNLMTSAFLQLEAHSGRPAGALAKLVFSSQEWCGALFEELLFGRDQVTQRRFSYFDGEGDQLGEFAMAENGITVDALFLRVRGFGGQLVAPGQALPLRVLPRLEWARLHHRDLAFVEGTLRRDAEATTKSVPAGRFSVDHYRLETADFRYDFWVGRAAPHPLVAWQGPDGEYAEMKGSARLKYWALNGPDGAKHLQAIGLKAP